MGWAAEAQAELVLKILVVNPSDTEVKEFDIKNPLPPEVKPEHVLDADGLKVDFDAQEGAYVLIGSVTLKPKESVTKRILLEDVWRIEPEQLSGLRRELDDILLKLQETPYQDRGESLGRAIGRRLGGIEESQDRLFLPPMQHITRFRENIKQLQMVEADLVSLRQLMVMAALNPSAGQPPLLDADAAPAEGEGGAAERGTLSVFATWQLIFVILGLLGFVSLSFYLVWRRQLSAQLDRQVRQERLAAQEPALEAGNGKHPAPAGGAPPLDRPGLQSGRPLSS